jgi:hypothetical protein
MLPYQRGDSGGLARRRPPRKRQVFLIFPRHAARPAE